jgi:hypothetical protein
MAKGIERLAGKFRICLASCGTHSLWHQVVIDNEGGHSTRFVITKAPSDRDVFSDQGLAATWRKFSEMAGIPEILEAAMED